jgi:predicted Fe-S protein YdhL (DUF1289 family)
MNTNPAPDIASPCIRNCCLNQDDICLGCSRSLNEILQWGNASNALRKQILEQVAQRKILGRTINAERKPSDHSTHATDNRK